MEINLNDLYKLIVGFQSNTEKQLKEIKEELSEIKQTVETTREHVARIDERLTRVEKISKVFDMDAIEKAAT